MLSEDFLTSVNGQHSINSAIAKEGGIHLHTLHPSHSVKSTFKKSSTPPCGLAINSSHVFAAQQDKAVIHVYSRERGSQEAIISFNEKIQALTLIGENVLALGTAAGRIILWEICTGRQIITPAAHLQSVTCLNASPIHLISGSEDSNVLVWSIPSLLSLSAAESQEPLRTLSNHRGPITDLVIGRSAVNTNICVSTSKDNSCIVWNYHNGHLLRTFLLPATPLCVTLDPCDIAVYLGYDNGSVDMLDLSGWDSQTNALFKQKLQSVPVQVSETAWVAPVDVNAAQCIALSYDGTNLLSGHSSGKVIVWDTGRKSFSGDLVDLNAPVNNLLMLSPFPKIHHTKAVTVVKPRLGVSNYTFIAQLTEDLRKNEFRQALLSPGIPSNILEAAMVEFSTPYTSTLASDEQLRKENDELWAIVNEQRALQKRTWDEYAKTKG